MKRKVLVVCHSNRSLGALEVIKFLASEAMQSSTHTYHFGVFKGINLSKEVKIAYEVSHHSIVQRIVFERLILPKIINHGDYNYVLSLQNFVLGNYQVPTGLLVHQGLMMLNYKYPAYEFKLLIKVLLQKLIFRVFQRHVTDFYVQLPWMKEKLISNYQINPEAIFTIRTHDIRPSTQGIVQFNQPFNFIYPASAYHYKNHQVVIQALQRLNNEELSTLKIQFTLDKKENYYTKSIDNNIKKNRLPIEFIGTMNHNELLNRYRTHILLFPSLVESQGFPLIEAMQLGAMIVCIDLPYARETLMEYPNVMYFDSIPGLTKIFQAISNNDDNLVFKIESKRVDYLSLIGHLEEALQ